MVGPDAMAMGFPVQSDPLWMKAILVTLLLCTALTNAEAQSPTPASVARGKTLADAGDCVSCHTSDPSRLFAGGRRIETPFGAIYSPNLTPDRETGIGKWSDDDFVHALHDGVAPDGSRYYPAFPYPYFTKLTREDMLAIRAYLATLPAVRNLTPAPELHWPLNDRVLMRGWNFLFFNPGPVQTPGAPDSVLARGAYLVEGLGHCGACHTPKNMFGADKGDQRYGGAVIDGWFAPRLDNAERSGVKSWSAEDIVEYLQSGRNGRSHAGGPMAEVIVNSTSKMTDDDVRAMAVYLKSLSIGAAEAVAVAPSTAEMSNGEKIYKGACIACHEADGTGSPRVYPPLPGNAALQSENPLSTLRVILDGAQTVTTARAPNTGSMPAYTGKLSDQDVADVATYIRNSWGNGAPAVAADQVAKARR